MILNLLMIGDCPIFEYSDCEQAHAVVLRRQSIGLRHTGRVSFSTRRGITDSAMSTCASGSRDRCLWILISCAVLWQLSLRAGASSDFDRRTLHVDCGSCNLAAAVSESPVVAFLGLPGSIKLVPYNMLQ